MIRILAPILLLAGSGVWATAHAETAACTNITTLPAVISTQGIYCLKQNLETAITSGAAITIATNNVTIDCNDWKIGGLQAGTGTSAIGIVADNRLNLTVRRCGVRGFRAGLSFTGGTSAGHLVEDNRFDLNTYIGLEVFGDGDIVRRNRIVDTGGSTNSTLSQAVRIGGAGASVTDNIVNGVTVAGANGGAYAFNIYGGNHEFSRNLVSSLVPNGTGIARGFYGSGFGSYRDNTLVGEGVAGSIGIDGGSSLSMCSGNHVHGFPTSFANCVNVNDNYAN